jgi:hypothetical protein
MAENTLLQGHAGIGTTQEWDENRHNRSENEHRSGNYENRIAQGRSNTNYGAGQQQNYGQEGNRWYENDPGNYTNRENYGTNYAQQPYGNEPYYGQNYGAAYGQRASYGQPHQPWNHANYGNPYFQGQQQTNYSPEQHRYGQYLQNWNQDYGRGSYGHYSNMGSGYGSNYGEGRSSQQYNPSGFQGEFGSGYQQNINQQYNPSGYGGRNEQQSAWGQPAWGQNYRSEYNRSNINSTPFSPEQTNDQRGWGGNTGSWQGAESSRYGYRGKGPRGYQRSDERIKEDVNDRLSDDSFIDASDIEVALSNGEVVLKGTVDSREAKRRAEDIAESISGVHNVENRLRVKQNTSSSLTGRWEDMNTDRSSINSGSERSNSKSSRSAS